MTVRKKRRRETLNRKNDLSKSTQDMEKGRYSYTIEQRDVDFMNQITHVDFMGYIIQAAGDDADKNGFGISDLNCGNCSWVLSRICIEYLRRPVRDEKITVATWVNDIGRMMTTRNMVVKDEKGEVVANAVTQWAVIDIDKRVAVDIRSNVSYENAFIEDESPVEKPARVRRAESAPAFKRRVAYSDIDFNRHMNAMKYIGWMIDVLPVEYLCDRELRRIDVNFLHEARYGQEIAMKLDDGEFSVFEITGDGGLPLCRAAFTWRDKTGRC